MAADIHPTAVDDHPAEAADITAAEDTLAVVVATPAVVDTAAANTTNQPQTPQRTKKGPGTAPGPFCICFFELKPQPAITHQSLVAPTSDGRLGRRTPATPKGWPMSRMNGNAED
jgi:hypothetical protein